MDWDTLRQTIAGEFSDLSSLAPLVQAAVRLLLAIALGACIGFQRERDGHEAGTRTHMLVCAGSALFLMVPDQMGLGSDAISRGLQGLLAGIGFLGAGSILKLPRAEHVRGLTTAAGIWVTAAVGVAAGLGRGWTAILSTVLVLGVLVLDGPITRLVAARRKTPTTHP